MAENKIDRRALKTQRALKLGLSELLIEKELRHITVQEVCDKADVHRVTFYKHYYDIYDLYDQLEKEILDSMEGLVKEHGEKNAFEFYPLIFKYIEENPKIFKMIFSPNHTGVLYKKLGELLAGLCRQIWKEHNIGKIDDEFFEDVIYYHTNGCMAIIAKWVLTDYAQSKEYIVKAISTLDLNTEKIILEND